MDGTGKIPTEAERFVITDNAFKSVGSLTEQMLGALKAQHPDRYALLNDAVANGIDLAVTFRFGEDSRVVLQIYDHTGSVLELACVNVKFRNPFGRTQ